MAYNYSKLEGRIVEKYKTRCAFAEALGITKESLSRKMTNNARFSQDEIFKACELLGIAKSEIHEYFFTI